MVTTTQFDDDATDVCVLLATLLLKIGNTVERFLCDSYARVALIAEIWQQCKKICDFRIYNRDMSLRKMHSNVL